MDRNHITMLLTLCFFSVFVGDVVAGALWDSAFLSDVAALLLLVLTSVCFTVAIVGFEQRERAKAPDDKSTNT